GFCRPNPFRFRARLSGPATPGQVRSARAAAACDDNGVASFDLVRHLSRSSIMEETVMLARFQSDPTSAGAADAASYVQTNLVSDVNGLAKVTDPNLANPWGVSFRDGSPFWISDQRSNSATLYSVDGSTGTDVNNPVPVFTVHIPTTLTGPQGPTGQVSNTNDSSFKLTDPLSDHKSASFIFADLNGEISAWNPSLGRDGSTASV